MRKPENYRTVRQVKSPQPKTEGQKKYLQIIKDNKITFCTGPAGTGKTCLATRFAISEFLSQKYKRLVITRPLVQAGENTGFLPGDIQTKMNPYMIPIYDELKIYIDCKQIQQYLLDGTIEIVPFAYMRGRTFHHTFILADECQNATYEQLKMLLTRFGMGSKMIINGDTTQSDIPFNQRGALETYSLALAKTDDIGTICLQSADIVREPIVASILEVIDQLTR